MDLFISGLKEELITFTQDLVRIKSYSGQEEKIIRFLEQKMKALGYEEVRIDSMGNRLGRIGHGEKSILFDSHVDTVEVNDETEWQFPRFSAEIVNGYLYGRGAVDMKSSAAASIYAGVAARQAGLASGKTVYVSCTVFEEDCDGENLKHLFQEMNLRPDHVVICEPSNNQMAAKDYLRGLTKNRIGMVGFSMGGAWSLILASHKPEEIAAIVLFYGNEGV